MIALKDVELAEAVGEWLPEPLLTDEDRAICVAERRKSSNPQLKEGAARAGVRRT